MRGQAVPQSYEKALYYYKLSSESGNIQATLM